MAKSDIEAILSITDASELGRLRSDNERLRAAWDDVGIALTTSVCGQRGMMLELEVTTLRTFLFTDLVAILLRIMRNTSESDVHAEWR